MCKHGTASYHIPAPNHVRNEVLDYQIIYTALVQHVEILARMLTSCVKNNLLMPYWKHVLCWFKLIFWARESLQQMSSFTIFISAGYTFHLPKRAELVRNRPIHKQKYCLYILKENSRNMLLMISWSKGWLLQKGFNEMKPTEALWDGEKIWTKCIRAVAKWNWQSCWESSMNWLKQ